MNYFSVVSIRNRLICGIYIYIYTEEAFIINFGKQIQFIYAIQSVLQPQYVKYGFYK